MTYVPNTPKDGEIAESCVWYDDRRVTNWQEAIDSAHCLTCDVEGCDISWLNQVHVIDNPNPVDLTYHAESGLWLCPTHYAEVKAEQAVTHG